MMIRSPETQQSPSTILLERELDSTDVTLRHALANVTKISNSSDYVHIRRFTMSLKTQTKYYEAASHALIVRMRHTGNIHEADQLIENRLQIVHGIRTRRLSCSTLG